MSRRGWFGGLRRGEAGFGHGDVEGSGFELGSDLGPVAVVRYEEVLAEACPFVALYWTLSAYL